MTIGDNMHVLMVIHYGKQLAVDKASQLEAWLVGRGHTVSKIGASDIWNDGKLSQSIEPHIRAKYDLVCTFGGDGTMLSAAQIVFRNPAPVLGFNFGRLGFLTGARGDDMFEAMQALFDGKLRSETRCALDIKLEYGDGHVDNHIVLNEVAMTRGVSGRMLDFDVEIDGELLSKLRADGIIVSSPTGSTAYSLSAGGPLVAPTLRCMLVSALAPHSLVSRSMITGEEQTVCIIPENRNNTEFGLFIDGNNISAHRIPAKITATVRKNSIDFMKYGEHGFTAVSSTAFFGGSND